MIHRECISKEAGRGRQLQLARSVFPPRCEFLRSFVQTTLLSEISLSSLSFFLSHLHIRAGSNVTRSRYCSESVMFLWIARPLSGWHRA